MKILHLSDLHFGTEVKPVVDALLQRVRELAPDGLIVSGDITQRARIGQFKKAQTFFNHLTMPHRIFTPGNHDIPLYNILARFVFPYRNYSRFFSLESVAAQHWPGATVVQVNSTKNFTIKDGRISDRQIRKAAEALQAAPASNIKIVTAHHPLAVLTELDQDNLCENARPAVEAWTEAGMDMILGGHIHYPFFRPLREFYPSLPKQREPWIVQAGTSVSRRIRSGMENNFVTIDIANESWQATRWDFQNAKCQFEATCHFPSQASV